MFTISDIVADVESHCIANNMIEDKFSYRIVYFINENGIGKKYYVDMPYNGLRIILENIIKENLTTTNTIVIAAMTTRKRGETVSLLSRSYLFSLEEYFKQLTGKRKNRSNTYNNRYAQAIY